MIPAKRIFGGWGSTAVLGLAVAVSCSVARAAAEGFKRPKADSRATFVHRIPLKDDEGKNLRPTAKEPKAAPYSPKETCANCHEYETINHGWHYNAAEGGPAGRPGEPWMLVDATTRTQLPVSYRGWKGTWKPADIGLTDWQFVTTFGRHYPGGGVGDSGTGKPQDPKSRWQISGRMNIDCLLCHNGDTTHDPNERAKQIVQENFKWAPTVALDLAGLKGEPRFAKRLPDEWTAKEAMKKDSDLDPGPEMHYDLARFNSEGLVYLNITKRPPSSRCYYCHTTRPAVERTEYWRNDWDVHLQSGLICVDCHRNGIDHMITRGYETEGAERKDPTVSAMSCRGCHMGVEGAPSAASAMGGRLGSPFPHHDGFPPVHFEKLACTACHAGFYPEMKPEAIQTSLAHALGYETAAREPQSAPGIVSPVFLRGADGKLAPHKMVWPNFWGYYDGKTLKPMSHLAIKSAEEQINKAIAAANRPAPKPAAATTRPATQGATTRPATAVAAAPATQPAVKLPAKPLKMPLPVVKEGAPEGNKPLTDAQVLEMFDYLAALGAGSGEPVYISGGKMIRRGSDGKLAAAEHEAAKPYAWPLGHDVRPASQSVGARGCNDCHTLNGPLDFAKVTPAGPGQPMATTTQTMYEMRGDSGAQITAFDLSFTFRPLLKIISFSCVGVMLGVLAVYGLRGLGIVLRQGNDD